MEPEDFTKKVGPLTKVFLPELYNQVIEYHSKTQFQFIYDILPLRLNSTIIKEKEEPALISYWILHPNTADDNPEKNPYTTFDKIPFDFHLIFRCSGAELAEQKWRDFTAIDGEVGAGDERRIPLERCDQKAAGEHGRSRCDRPR